MWIPNTTQRNLSQKQTHIEIRSVVAKRRGGRGLDWKFGIARCRLLDTGCISNKVFYPIQHSRGQPFVNPWTIQSLEFSRPEHRSEWPFPSPGALPNPGIEPRSSKLPSDSYQLSHKGSPRILECVAYPSSSGSSRPRNQTRVSRTAGRFFTSWATREGPGYHRKLYLISCNNSYWKRKKSFSKSDDHRDEPFQFSNSPGVLVTMNKLLKHFSLSYILMLLQLLSHFSCVWLFVTPWTVVHQGLCLWDSPGRILEWVALPSARGSSQPKDWAQVS